MATMHALNADEWRDIASQSFVPLIFPRAATDFRASMDLRHLGSHVSLSKIATQALVIERTSRLAAQSNSDDIHISLQIGARGSVLQNQRVTPVGPGTLTMCETHRPFTLRYTEPNQQHIVLQIPRASLGVSDRVISLQAGREIGRQSPARNAFVYFVRSVMFDTSRATISPDPDVLAVISTLAAAMLRNDGLSSVRSRDNQAAMFAVIVEFIRANLELPELNPDLIARTHFVSRRRLYELFDAANETPSDFIRRNRLRRAADILSTPGPRRPRVADVAYSVGFTDSTTFTRAFVRHFGLTPSEFQIRAHCATPQSSE